jgi:hypothetical protein
MSMTDRGMPSRFESDAAPPEELFSRIRAAVAVTPSSTTSTRSRIAVAVAVVPFVAAAVLLLASQLVYDRPAVRIAFGTPLTSQLLLVALMLVALTLGSTFVAIGRGQRGLGHGVAALFLVVALVAPIYAALTMVHPLEAGPAAALADVSPWGLRCLVIASAVGALVLVIFTAALRRSVPVASRARAAAIGTAAGAWAGLTVFVFCPDSEPRHLLVGHVLPIVAFTILGLAVIPRLLRP